MGESTVINVPVNRVEGDLDVRARFQDGAIVDATCSGTMFRGFERILVGRGPLDGLVITPRICGICSTSHLAAAALALDAIFGATVTGRAVRIRNIAHMAEHLQSDVRQSCLTFAADFANPALRGQPLFDEAERRYAPFRGDSVREVVRQSKKLLEIVAIVGGQWPHSSFMVPGGIASVPSRHDLLQCQLLLDGYRRWLERRVIGCSLERFAEVRSAADLDVWLDESPEQRDSEVGFLLRYGRALNLHQSGRGHDCFLSFGALSLPEGTLVRSPDPKADTLVPSGVITHGKKADFDPSLVTEAVDRSWFENGGEPLHPFDGVTRPYATGVEGDRYTWAKAPRYGGAAMETGPLAEALVAGDPLFVDLHATEGPSALLRQLARLCRCVRLVPPMARWIDEALDESEPVYVAPQEVDDGQGAGLTHASRGALGHWVRIEEGKISKYQIITPTAWNASPRDGKDLAGPIEQALAGTPVQDPQNPVELGFVVRSFDPCLVCTVHAVRLQGTAP